MSDAGQEVNEVDQTATDTGEQTSNNVESLKKRIISTSKLFQYLKAAKQGNILQIALSFSVLTFFKTSIQKQKKYRN
jgi:hypothetical protein